MEDNYNIPIDAPVVDNNDSFDIQENNNQGHNYSLEAEKYVIGCVLLEPEVVIEVMHRVKPDDFYDPRHRAIMKAITNIYERNEVVEFTKVWEELVRLKLDSQVGSMKYIANILESVPSVANVTSYVEIIEEKSLLRSLMRLCENVRKEIIDGKNNFKTISRQTDERLQNVINRRKTIDIKRIENFTDDVITMAEGGRLNENNLLGLDTGFQTLNKATSGLQKGELIILAARPGIGKSALAMNIATYAARNVKATVAYFSLEMSNTQLVARVLSSFSGLNFKEIRDGKLSSREMLQLSGAQAEVNKFNLYLDVECNTNLDDIRAKCMKLKREGKLDLIVVDYLQLVTDVQLNAKGVATGSRQEEVSRVSRGLKKMARDFDCPVLALSQLSRDVEKRNATASDATHEHEPNLSDLRESGSIEQDADVVLFLHRPGAKEQQNKRASSYRTQLIIAKNRQGEQTKIDLIFRGPQFTFRELKDKDAEEEVSEE